MSEFSNKEPRQLDPLVLEDPVTDGGIQMEIRGDNKTVVDWVNGKARERGAIGGIQRERQLREWWGNKTNTRRKENDWAVYIFRERMKADASAARRPEVKKEEWEDEEGVLWVALSMEFVRCGMVVVGRSGAVRVFG